MQRTAPPFRADHVGSLLRPAAVKEARARFQRGEIAAGASARSKTARSKRSSENRKRSGFSSPLTGSFGVPGISSTSSRGWTVSSFIRSTEGITFHRRENQGQECAHHRPLDFSSHPHVDDFRFLKEHTRVCPKMTIPAPNMLHFRPGRRSISREVYPDLEPFFEDVADASRKAVRAFYDAGCRYLQFDDTTWSMMCDERELALSRERGDQPEKLPAVVRAHDQSRARRQARRHDGHDAFVPRQLPLDLDRGGRL